MDSSFASQEEPGVNRVRDESLMSVLFGPLGGICRLEMRQVSSGRNNVLGESGLNGYFNSRLLSHIRPRKSKTEDEWCPIVSQKGLR